jgi:ubiquinone/menaquinone biosynthesis C-methylase UbiE
MKALLRRVAATPFRVLPRAARRRLVQAVVLASGARAPAEALRELLTLDSDLSGQIDLAAMAYGQGVHVKHRLMRYHDFFVARVRAGERVLDLGCGYGAVAYSVAAHGSAVVVGLDKEPSNIAKAERLFKHERLTFVCGEAPRHLPAGPFDAVVLSNVLEHVDRRPEFLRAVQTVAAPSRWLIRVPLFDRDWRPSLRRELDLFAYGDPTHFTEYTVQSFEAEMRETGFDIEHLQVNWGEIWSEVRPRDMSRGVA